MLTPIQSAIKAKRKIKPWVDARMDRMRWLDKEVRAVGGLLLGCKENEREHAGEGAAWRMRIRAVYRLLAFDEESLLSLGAALFPQFPDVFKAAWTLYERLPIQEGFARKPFRAPSRPDLMRLPRASFLANLTSCLEGLDESIEWIAEHATHISTFYAAHHLGVLLAAAIDAGGKQSNHIVETLRAATESNQTDAQFGRHVIAAMLCSSNRDNWQYIGKLLLAAQRQEGLRQAILESVDFAHPDAFRYMLDLIVDENLCRFSATVRAADVWLGLMLDSQSAKYAAETIGKLRTFLADEKAITRALRDDEPQSAYFALWSVAFDDVPASIEPARKLLRHKNAAMRLVGAQLLAAGNLPEGLDAIAPAIDDADERVATYAAAVCRDMLQNRMNVRRAMQAPGDDPMVLPGWITSHRGKVIEPPKDSGDIFERLDGLLKRLPAKAKAKTAKPLVWPWENHDLGRAAVADGLLLALGERPHGVILPYIDQMSPTARQRTANFLGSSGALDAATRGALLKLVGDTSPSVREAAVQAMKAKKLEAADLPTLEPLLERKTNDLRRGVLALILSLKDADVLDSARRLLAEKSEPLRLAGLDLLQQLRDAKRAVAEAQQIASDYRAARDKLTREELTYLEKLQHADVATVTCADALGLMDPAKRTPPTAPRPNLVKFASPAAKELLKLIDAAVTARRDQPVTIARIGGDSETTPLGAIQWYGFPEPFDHSRKSSDRALVPIEQLPLHEVWLDLWRNRPDSARDADGLDTLRALILAESRSSRHESRARGWRGDVMRDLLGDLPPTKFPDVVAKVILWLAAFDTNARVADFAVDGFESLLAQIPKEKLTAKGDWHELAFREFINQFGEFQRELRWMAEIQKQWTDTHQRRLFGLLRWVDEPVPGVPRNRMDCREMLAAFDAGFANEHDLYDDLLGERPHERYSYGYRFSTLDVLSASHRREELSPRAAQIVQAAIDRVLEVELARGEAETPASAPALALSYSGGLDVLIRVLNAIGRDPKLQRTSSWRSDSLGKSTVFSHVLQVTMPGKDDTPAAFAAAVKAAQISEDILLAVALYAPQWAAHVEAALGWKMLAEGVWWLHAHTKDKQWSVESDIRDSWNAEIRKLTPLTLDDLLEGAVDVDWFQRVHTALGQKRWERLDEYAKYASGGAGHKRAQLFADAMLGNLKKDQQLKDIEGKRKQDAVRALGLIPLAKGGKKEVLERYKVMQEFVRTSRQFGSQRQASEKLAARIGQENLARTAGYPDPIRLQWAMEGLATADLAKGPVIAKVKDFVIELAIDSDGLPEVSCRRGDKPLKNIPPDVKKNTAVAELGERKTELRRSASRMRQSLEQAMCRGDRFTGEELIELCGNVLLRPLLERLVFVGEGIVGYPIDGGKGLRDHAGKVEPVKKSETLRLAHPHDLLSTKAWSQWQRECFAAERVQPFKQVFRELYVLTGQEKSDATFSARYAGQQVNPRQALAMLGSRGWVTAPEEGVFRTYHDEKIVAWIEFQEGFHTPADVEGLTVERVRFARRGASEFLKLVDVPPRLLSETMRDVDLIVSVAHRGGVDPEASASTVEMRAALVRETAALLKLGNVKITPPLVHIAGTRSEYSVHLGSATTHMLPGGSLYIVPVHSQHRGRIFLPFADDDPKTAEVMSKVLLLARDEEIKDPNVLDQIRSAAS